MVAQINHINNSKKYYSPEDDRVIREHVNTHGPKNWKQVANAIHKTASGCSCRFWRSLATQEEKASRANKFTYTPEQDRAIREHVNTHGLKNWKRIADAIDKTASGCSAHFWRSLATQEEKASRANKFTYTPEQDRVIREHVNTHGSKNWYLVANAIDKTASGCSARFWRGLATPQEKASRVDKLTYTPEQDRAIREHFNTHGSKDWKRVANAIHKTAVGCRDHFWRSLATKEEKASRDTVVTYTLEEDRALREHFNTHGSKNWYLVANAIDKTASGCRARFWRSLATREEKASKGIVLTYTLEEDRAIREHVDTHGPKNWHLVAGAIHKTVSGCRGRFWRGLATQEEKANRGSILACTSEEEAAIREHVNTHGPKNWHLVANAIHKAASGCRDYFWRNLATQEEKACQGTISTYTPEEDRAIREHFNTYGSRKWHLVADAIYKKAPGCRERFWRILATPQEKASRVNRSIYTSEDDGAIRKHVNTHGPKNWKQIADAIHKKAPGCRERFWRILATKEEKARRVNRSAYNSKEDRVIREHFNTHGSRKWHLVADAIHRTPLSCRTRFWRILATKEEKASRVTILTYTPEEDAALREHVDTYGLDKWHLVADAIHKTATSCRARFWRILATPEEKASRVTSLTYTPEEDAALREHVSTHGLEKWHLVADAINKTASGCRDHFWRNLATKEEKANRAKGHSYYTPEEDRAIRELVNTHGLAKWHLVADAINKTAAGCRARFWRTLATPEEKANRAKRNLVYTSDEDRAIREHVNTYGTKNWKRVANTIDRTAESCRARFWSSLATSEEINRLASARKLRKPNKKRKRAPKISVTITAHKESSRQVRQRK